MAIKNLFVVYDKLNIQVIPKKNRHRNILENNKNATSGICK
jgi:hypothetical protein